jgi:hypothetical protein
MATSIQPDAPTTYTTPTKRAAFAAGEAGPSRARPAGASPAYVSFPLHPGTGADQFPEFPSPLSIRNRRSYNHRVSRPKGQKSYLSSRMTALALGYGKSVFRVN